MPGLQSPHHKLLSRGRVYGDRVVKVLLRRAHLDRNRDNLHDLIRPQPNDVHTHHLLLLAHTDQLVRGWLLVLGHAKVHRGEASLADLDLVVAVLLARLRPTVPEVGWEKVTVVMLSCERQSFPRR